MATTIHMQGGSIDLDENFNMVRQRLNQAQRALEDYRNGTVADGTKFRPYHDLSFKTEEGGRISINPEKIIAVESDLPNDKGSKSDDEDDDE
jgi:hypothetical protein